MCYAANWNGAKVAVKVFCHELPGSLSYERVENEIKLVRKALHPSVVMLLSIVRSPGSCLLCYDALMEKVEGFTHVAVP